MTVPLFSAISGMITFQVDFLVGQNLLCEASTAGYQAEVILDLILAYGTIHAFMLMQN
jgi:hypothetical protein